MPIKHPRIRVVDAIMGSGKSSFVPKFLADGLVTGDWDQFVVLSPNESEVCRGGRYAKSLHKLGITEGVLSFTGIHGEVPVMKEAESTEQERKLTMAAEGQWGKVDSLRRALNRGDSCLATHEAFKRLTKEDFEEFKKFSNVLVLDEVMDIVEKVSITAGNLQFLLDNEIIAVDESGVVSWEGAVPGIDCFQYPVYQKIITGGVTMVTDVVTKGKRQGTEYHLLFWSLPVELLNAFNEVIILTYMFKSSMMNLWLHQHGLAWEPMQVALLRDPEEIRKEAKELIHVVTDKKTLGSFSASWYGALDGDSDEKKASPASARGRCAAVATRLNSAVQHKLFTLNDGTVVSPSDMLYTCPKTVSEKLMTVTNTKKGPDGSEVNTKVKSRAAGMSWLAATTKATNEYSQKAGVAYMYVKNPNHYSVRFLGGANKEATGFTNEGFALSALLQFVWRTRIRGGMEADGTLIPPAPIVVYLPEKGLYEAFTAWLEGNDCA